MANIKSQIKRNKQNQGKRQRNRVYRGAARTYVRKAQAAIKSGVEVNAQAEVKNAIKALDKAITMGVIHKNNAARRKSRLVKKLNSLQ
ncbi:MAG: 30S ribosomal protein S20 [Anaerolineaceae bacterium]